ncbi:protein of unknown function [Serratia sp. Tan611]|nr:protein of unknown function [Serratia sp. Tan611]
MDNSVYKIFRKDKREDALPHLFRRYGFIQGEKIGAGNEARTRDLNLGKVALYQLSYSRTQEMLYSIRPKMKMAFEILERETRLELATSTLARLRSTN